MNTEEIKELVKQGFAEMSVKYRSEKSYNGFSLDVLKSALQKYIRRCNPEMAIYAAAELDLFSFDPKGEGIRSNLIHRLMIIFMEDVYAPNIWKTIDHYIFKLLHLRDIRKNKDVTDPIFCETRREEIDALCRIVYDLSISPHSRENSYYRYCLYTYFNEKPLISTKIEQHFPWIVDLKAKKETVFEPKNIPSFVGKIQDSTTKRLVKNFIGALFQRDEMCIYYGHRISELKESPTKFFNSKKPAYMIFALIDFVLETEKRKKQREMVEIGKRWYKELNPIKEDFLCWQSILLFLIKEKKEEEREEKDEMIEKEEKEEKEEKKKKKLYKLYRRNLEREIIEFDEWVYDMHTRIGKIQGKGSAYFAEESSMVCNEIKDINQGYKDIYIYIKILQDDKEEQKEQSIKKEEKKVKSPSKNQDIRSFLKSMKKEENSEEKREEKKENISTFIKSMKNNENIFVENLHESDLESKFSKFVMRAQLVTGNIKTDTYYGEREGKLIFIKGPIVLESVEPFMELQNVKKKLGLPTLNYQIVFLKPDLFADVSISPLGRRHQKGFDRKKLHPFIVCDVLFDHTAENIPYRIHSSKLWPETKIIDFDKVKGMQHLEHKYLKKDSIMREFIQTIIFRYIMGLGDLAPRNFIVKNDRIYSIDEDIIDKDFDIDTNLKRIKGIYNDLVKNIQANRSSYVDDELDKYNEINLTDGAKKRLKEVKTYLSRL